MNDLDEPLRPYGERRLEAGRRALDMRWQRRSSAARIAGVLLVAAGIGGVWWFSQERAPLSASSATVALGTSPVTASIGEVIDRRTPEPEPKPVPRIDEGENDVVMLDRTPLPLETWGEEDDARDRHPPHLPRPELLEDAPEGPLPRIADGLTPFDAYRVRKPVAAAARVAIVVGGLGLSQTGTKRAIETLPEGVTLAFSPDGNSLRRWTEAARRDGHEIALQLPLEPIGWPDVSPSPRTVTRDDPSPDAVAASLGRLTTYPVVMNYLGTAFSLDEDAMRALLADLKSRGLGYLDDGRAQAGKARAVAGTVGLPFAQGSVLLDEERGAAAVDRALDRLAEEAKTRGWAIATGTAFPTTVERVRLFAEAAKKKGIVLVPVSNLMRRR